MKHKLLLLLLAAFLIRLIALNQSLWLDEGTTAKVVSTFNFTTIVTHFSLGDFHPPFYYFLMKVWTAIFGYSEVALRFPSVIFSLLTGATIFVIGKKLQNATVGFWAAAFFLFNPLIVYYSQEARMYMMATFLLTEALLNFLIILKKPNSKNLILFNAFIFLSFFTFYGSVFFIISLYVYIIVAKKGRLLPYLIPGFLLALLVLSPLLLAQLAHAQSALSVVVNWKSVLGTANIKNAVLIPLKFAFGRISFHPKLLYYAAAGIWSLFIYSFVIRKPINTRENTSIFSSILLFLFLIPLALGFLASFVTPLLQYFRFLYLVPILSLLLALGAQKKWQRTVLAGGFAVLSLVYILNPQFHREDWKSLSRALPADKKIFMILSSSDALIYYRQDLQLEDIRDLKKAASQREVIVLPYVASLYGLDYAKELHELGFTRVSETSLRELTFEVWRRYYAGSFLYSRTVAYVRIETGAAIATRFTNGGARRPRIGVR